MWKKIVLNSFDMNYLEFLIVRFFIFYNDSIEILIFIYNLFIVFFIL